MRTIPRHAAALAVTVLSAPALAAQSVPDLCRAASDATVGQWASFAVSGGRADPSTLRLAIVGSERQGDSTFYWFEVSGSSAKDPSHNGIMQMLVPGPGLRATSVHGLIAKLGDQPAVKMSQQMLAMMGQRMAQNAALDFGRRCESARVLGSETITVPAGSFPTVHLKSEDGEAWISKTVPFAIVKTIGGDGATLTLTGYGADAKSLITETPQEMPLPGAMTKP